MGDLVLEWGGGGGYRSGCRLAFVSKISPFISSFLSFKGV